jgi:hypothetical protein
LIERWYKVLLVCYGEEDGLLKEGGGGVLVGRGILSVYVIMVGVLVEDGFVIVCPELWVMGGTLFFGLICG